MDDGHAQTDARTQHAKDEYANHEKEARQSAAAAFIDERPEAAERPAFSRFVFRESDQRESARDAEPATRASSAGSAA